MDNKMDNLTSEQLRDMLITEAEKFNSGIAFMDDREKGDIGDLKNKIIVITDYDFLNAADGGQYIVFIIQDNANEFYFGGQVLTDRMAELDKMGYGPAIRKVGIPVRLEDKTSKRTKRTYTNAVFYP